MQLTGYIWSLIFLALFSANLPFINQRLFGVIVFPLKGVKKSFWWRLSELAVLYFLLGSLGYVFETSMGNVFPQTWEFFAISVCLFIVLTFPGFVYQYLHRA